MPWTYRPPGSPRSAPSRRCAGAPGRPGSSCRSAAWECVVHTAPARVCQSRSRYPLRWFPRSGLRSPWAAPDSPSVSSSISRWAAKPIISCRKVVSELSICFAAQPRSSRGAIVSSVIVVISRFRLCLDNPTLPRITAGATDRPACADSRRSLRQAAQWPPTPPAGTRLSQRNRRVLTLIRTARSPALVDPPKTANRCCESAPRDSRKSDTPRSSTPGEPR